MKRILITGAPGSGTSTLGRALAERLGCKFFDADDYYWLPTHPPFAKKATSENRAKTFLADIDIQSCVVAGSVVDWGREIEERFDLIVFRLLDTNIRLERLLARETTRFGKADPIFMEWAANYDEGSVPGRSRPIHEAWLSQRTCTIIRIEGNISLDDQIEMVIGATINTSLDAAASRRSA